MKKHTHHKAMYGNSERSNQQGSKFLRKKWQDIKKSASEALQSNPVEFNLKEDIMPNPNPNMRSP